MTNGSTSIYDALLRCKEEPPINQSVQINSYTACTKLKLPVNPAIHERHFRR